ncbi:MAG: FtsQ-type POTRA domain-containing protein [Treponema sp.]|nr:FtsQ-type POTRA domain-containing protein [Treponema sp.]
MSSDYLYGDEVGSRPRYHSTEYKKLKFILAVITIILGVELVWLFGVSPCMPLSKITILGIQGIDEEAVLALAGIGKHSSYMTINAKSAEEALLALPMIRSARVVKRFPNRVELHLESRRAAAMAFVTHGGKIFPALIDGEGIIINVGKEGFLNGETLPVISGLVLEGVYPGMKLPRMYNTLFARLDNLTRTVPELLATVSEIRINHRNYDGYDLTLYPAHKGVRVRVSQDITEETLRYMLLMLDVLSEKSGNIREIDFRTGTASYKEAYSG